MGLLTKEDLKTHIYAEIVDEISRADDSIVEAAIAAGEGEAKAYLNRYNKAAMFDENYPDHFFRNLVKSIVCWHFITLCNPNVSLELFRTQYEDAIKTLDKVMKGNIDPDWPLRIDEEGNNLDESGHVSWNSNIKRRNHY